MTPATVKRGKKFTTYGYLKPRHTGTTKVYFYRKVGSKLKLYRWLSAGNHDYHGYTKYTLSATLPTKGTWVVKAYHADAGHRATWSAGQTFKVK